MIMIKIFLFIISLFIYNIWHSSFSICTMEYSPMCWEKKIECVKAPCEPIKKTYWNKCQLNSEKATLVYYWECLEKKKEDKVNKTLDKFFSDLEDNYKKEVANKIISKIDLLLKEDYGFWVKSSILNYIKYYLNTKILN